MRALAREILEGDAYARWHRAPGALVAFLEDLRERVASAWKAFWGWLAELLGLDGVEGLGGGWGIDENWLLFAFCLVVGSSVGFFVAYGFRRGRGAVASPRMAEGRSSERRLLAEAAKLAEVGRSLEAAHTLQLAVLELLLRRGWLELERSDPNATLRRRLEDSDLSLVPRRELVGLIDRLERGWFRDRLPDADLYGGWLAFYRSLDTGGASA